MSKTASKQTSKAVAKDKSPKSSEEKQFSATIISNFLNNYYRNISLKSDNQSVSFKVFPTDDKANKVNKQFVIDLYEYQGLLNFIALYKAAQDKGIDFIIERTFDMRLRACLDSARVFKTNDKNKINVFQEFILPQLGFDTSNFMNITDYIKGVGSYFTNESKLKTKIYNLVFPHDSHNQDKLPVGVNVIYLQHVSKYHDDVLDMVINKGLEEEDVLRECQQLYAKEQKLAPEVLAQLFNDEIVVNVHNPPEDAKWIEKLAAIKPGKKKGQFVDAGRSLTTEEKKAVRALVRELQIVKSFIKIINGGKNARKVVKDDEGKDIAVPLNPNLQECLKQYHEIYDKTIAFHKYWQKTVESELKHISNEKDKINLEDVEEDKVEETIKANELKLQYQLFLRYFIETVRFIKNELHNGSAFKTFINDVKKDICFKFSKNLRAKLDALVNQEEKVTTEQLEELAKDNYKDWSFINSPKTYDPNDLAVYSKIGKFCQLDIRKEYRVAVGIAIVDYIQNCIQLIQAANRKKKELQLYIKI